MRSNAWRNGLGGTLFVLVAHLVLAHAYVADLGPVPAVGLSYVLVLAAGVLLVALALGRTVSELRPRSVKRVAGVLFAAGVFLWMAVGYVTDPGWNTLFYVLRWGGTAVVLALVLVYYPDRREPET